MEASIRQCPNKQSMKAIHAFGPESIATVLHLNFLA